MTDDLVTWLREQIDYTEQWAKLAAAAATDGGQYVWELMASATVAIGEEAVQTGHRDTAIWIKQQEPLAVLAQCEAHHRVLDRYERADKENHAPDAYSLADDLLRALALAYQHRPGYREEWRP